MFDFRMGLSEGLSVCLFVCLGFFGMVKGGWGSGRWWYSWDLEGSSLTLLKFFFAHVEERVLGIRSVDYLFSPLFLCLFGGIRQVGRRPSRYYCYP